MDNNLKKMDYFTFWGSAQPLDKRITKITLPYCGIFL